MTERDDPYKRAGVDYEVLDAAKRDALAAALETSSQLERSGGRAFDNSRGEPAFVFEYGGTRLAIVEECLGTKSRVARELEELTSQDFFDACGYDTVAAIVNDLICVGALPLVVNAYFATGSSEWYGTGSRSQSLIRGWKTACIDAGATWGGGESPTLAGLMSPSDIELAGAAVGALPDGTEPILGQDLAQGDEIVLIASSGIHTNGLSLATQIAASLERGWLSEMPSGATFGEALLRPSFIYAPLVRGLLEDGTPVTYMSHLTGHGLRKIMRSDRELSYHIESLQEVPEVLQFMVGALGLSQREAYATLNMGSGFAVYVRSGHGQEVVDRAEQLKLSAIVAGHVEEGPRKLVLEPLGLTFDQSELLLR